MAVPRYRDIREEPEYTAAVAEIAARYPRVYEVEAGVSWSLARNPGQHHRIVGTDYHVLVTENFGEPTIPRLRILYRFDGEVVYLLDARLAEDILGRE